MPVTVLDSKDQLKALETGEIPVPPEVAADRGETPKPVEEPPAEVPAEPTEPAEPVEDDDGLTAEQKKEFTEKMQKSIARKHRQMKEAEEFAAEQLRASRVQQAELDRLTRESKRLQEELSRVKPPDPDAGKPQRENFDSEEKYRDAVDDWRVEQKFAKREAEQAKKREEERQAAVLETAQARIAHAIEVVPDWQEVTEAVDMEVPPVVAGYMQESPMFAELGYYFAKHTDQLANLHKLSAPAQLVEVGRILATLEPFAAETPAKPAAKANGQKPSSTPTANGTQSAGAERPAPSRTATEPSQVRAPVIKPLTSGSVSQVTKPEPEMNIREVIGDWSKRNRVNLHQRKRH